MANREKGTAAADKFSELIQILVTPAVKKELKVRATIEGKCLSHYLREVCEEEAGKKYNVEGEEFKKYF
tara:strand:+ start:281 stop:487 length:207 start_codon:yes stop_codon:yes gene_type:complete